MKNNNYLIKRIVNNKNIWGRNFFKTNITSLSIEMLEEEINKTWEEDKNKKYIYMLIENKWDFYTKLAPLSICILSLISYILIFKLPGIKWGIVSFGIAMFSSIIPFVLIKVCKEKSIRCHMIRTCFSQKYNINRVK